MRVTFWRFFRLCHTTPRNPWISSRPTQASQMRNNHDLAINISRVLRKRKFTNLRPISGPQAWGLIQRRGASLFQDPKRSGHTAERLSLTISVLQ